jgi:serine phosphatase RsbU (regulator of sigma subunit)
MKRFSAILLITSPFFIFSQNRKSDSLYKLMRSATIDSVKLSYELDLAYAYMSNAPDSTLSHLNSVFKKLVPEKYLRLTSRAYNMQGIYYENRGDFKKAINNYLEGMKIDEQRKDEDGIASYNNNIGLLFLNMGNFKLALEYYNKALAQYQKKGKKQNLADIYNNIGIVYCSQNMLDTCLKWQLKSIELKKEIGDKSGLATSYDNVGTIYQYQGKKDECLKYFKEAMRMKIELNDKIGLCITYLNTAQAFRELKDYPRAMEYDKKVLILSTAMKSKIYQQHAYESAAVTAAAMKDFKTAYEYEKFYTSTKDSMLNEQSNKNIEELQTKYESEKKDNQISLLNKDNELKQADLKKQQVVNFAITGGLIIVLIASVIILKNYREKKKANALLEEKNIAIEKQNLVISEKKKEIEDSINYARYIQQSILPDKEIFESCFNDYFLFFMPKDIVSGDFYHLDHDSNKIHLAVVDCTGHGVPGGFMSVIGAEVFEQAIKEKNNSPGEALAFVNKKIKSFLRQQRPGSSSKDGMDAALCYIDKKKNKLLFSGANRPLYIIRNKELQELEPTKSALGGITESEQVFKEFEFTLEKNDTVYLFSDGYADQFGGEKGKKMMTKNFKKLLLGIQDKSMKEQRVLIQDNFISWRGTLEQLDDILVIGFKWNNG